MLQLILVLAVIGFLAWLVTEKIPMDATIKMAIRVIIVVVMVLYVMQVLGVSDIPLPRLR